MSSYSANVEKMCFYQTSQTPLVYLKIIVLKKIYLYFITQPSKWVFGKVIYSAQFLFCVAQFNETWPTSVSLWVNKSATDIFYILLIISFDNNEL